MTAGSVGAAAHPGELAARLIHGTDLADGWVLSAHEARHGNLKVHLVRGKDAVWLGLTPRAPGADPGPLGSPEIRCWLQGNAVPVEHLRGAASALLALLGADSAATLLRHIGRNDGSTAKPKPRAEMTLRRTIDRTRLPATDVPGALCGGWTTAAATLRGQVMEVPFSSSGPVAVRLELATTPDLGPFGRDGVRVTHAGRTAAPGLSDAVGEWLDLLTKRSSSGALLDAVRGILFAPDLAELATATLTLQPLRSGDDEQLARYAKLISSLQPRVTTALRVPPEALHEQSGADERNFWRELLAGVPAGVEVSTSNATDRGGSRETDEAPHTQSNVATAENPTTFRATPTDDWEDELRSLLIAAPQTSVRLGDIVAADQIPNWPCALPWIRYEVSPSGWQGPCCRDYQAIHHRLDRAAQPADEWNSEGMQRFRRAMTGDGHPTSCLASCPFLNAGTQKPADVQLRGGPIAHVENVILTVRELLAGAIVMTAKPLQLCIAATTFCNYDCLMCDYGETGTLEDELQAPFWDGLGPLLQTAQSLEINGGEPLGSPVLREFLATIDSAKTPQLRVLLITNGSYLGAKQLRKYATVPFENVTVSLNAATGPTYETVNRGLTWDRIRENLDAIGAARRSGQLAGRVQYSMVLLRQNLHEISAFAAMARRDGATIRYQLPLKDRNKASIMTAVDTMFEAMRALQDVAAALLQDGRIREARGAAGNARVLWQRIAAGIVQPL